MSTDEIDEAYEKIEPRPGARNFTSGEALAAGIDRWAERRDAWALDNGYTS